MEIDKVKSLITESRSEETLNIDNVSTVEMIEMINNEDKKVPEAVGKVKENIAKAVDLIADKLSKGGRLIYVGAGTSGRLGVVDASECPPTFGVDYDLVQGVMAGGESAFIKAVEGAEDYPESGKNDLIARGINEKDIVCGIAASGRTPYVIGAMEYAKSIGSSVICVTMNPKCKMVEIADIPIAVVVGPEAIMGSTRMKSGTAQKLVLNMLTTGTMIKLGKVYGNLMVDVQSTNEKLVARAKRIVIIATDVDEETAAKTLHETDYDVKLSIFMIKSKINKDEAKKILNEHKGYIQKALDSLHK
jgi:N-acetylmuramic acid 6-phosphate etherase